MPIAKFVTAGPAVHVGDFSASLLAELRKPSFVLVPIIRIVFPETSQTDVLLPTATLLKDAEHSVFGAATVHEALDDPPGTPDTGTYVWSDGTDNHKMFSRVTFASLNPLAVAVQRVRLFCRARMTDTNHGTWSFGLFVGASTYYQSGAPEPGYDRFTNDGFQTVFYEFDLNPDTGAAWTPAQVAPVAGEIVNAIDGLGEGTNGQNFTQMWLEVDYTTQDVGRYSIVGVNSRSEGLYEPLIQSIDSPDVNLTSPANALQKSSAGAVLFDPDRTFSDLLASQKKLSGAAVDIRWISPDVTDKADWYTVFVGLLEDQEEIKANTWKLKFKQDDTAFQGSTLQPKFTEPDFPAAPDPKIYDIYVPQIYGVHSSQELNNDGMVKLFRVADAAFVSSYGRIKEHTNLYTYESGDPPTVALLTPTTDWVEWYPIKNGRQYSGAQLVGAGAAANKEKEIRADLKGYEETGDGTGLLLTNPALQFLHWFVNFVFSEYASGNWKATTGLPVNTVRFTEARDFFNRTGQAGSRYIGGKTAASGILQEINRFSKNLEIKVWFDNLGLVSIGVNDHATIDVYPTTHVIEEGLHDLTDPKYKEDGRKILNKISIAYLRQEAENQFLANVDVEDIEIEDGAAENLQAFWLPSSLPQFIE
jgi:hypothetical protein